MFIEIIQVKGDEGLNSGYEDYKGILDTECVRLQNRLLGIEEDEEN